MCSGIGRVLKPLHGDEGVSAARVCVGSELSDIRLAHGRVGWSEAPGYITEGGTGAESTPDTDTSNDRDMLIGGRRGLAIAWVGPRGHVLFPPFERQFKSDFIQVEHTGGRREAGIELLL